MVNGLCCDLLSPTTGFSCSEGPARAPSHDRARSAETRDEVAGEMQAQVPSLATAVPALALPGTASCTAWPSTAPTSWTSSCGRYRSKFPFPHTSAGRASKGTQKRSWTAGVERRLTFARSRSSYKTCPKPSGCVPAISCELIEGWGVNIFGRISARNQPVAGNRHVVRPASGFLACSFSQRAKSTVPGNGVIITNWAKVMPAFSAMSTVASKVAGLSVGSPKMNDPRTWTPCCLKVSNCFARASPD